MTTGQTTRLSASSINPGFSTEAVVADGKVWFDCLIAQTGHELCSSDGTAQGTGLVEDLRAGLTGSSPRQLAVVNGDVVVIANDGVNGRSLFMVDQQGGLELIYDAYSGAGNNSDAGAIGGLTITDTFAVFIALDGVSGNELHAWNHISGSGEWIIWP